MPTLTFGLLTSNTDPNPDSGTLDPNPGPDSHRHLIGADKRTTHAGRATIRRRE